MDALDTRSTEPCADSPALSDRPVESIDRIDAAAPASLQRTDRVWAMLISGLLVAITLSAFARVIGCGFVNFDDNEYVYANHYVQHGLSAPGVHWALTTGYMANYQPLVWLSYMLDRQLWGPEATGFHAVNLALHVINTLILLWLLRGLMSGRGAAGCRKISSSATWRAALVAAIFAVHPLRVESVAWISERKDGMAMLFGLLAIASYVRYVRRPGAGRYAAVAGFFILSLLSKPLFVTFPALLLLLDYWPLRRDLGWRRLMIEKLPLFGITVASSIATFFLQRASGAVITIDHFPLGGRITNAIVSYVRYMGMLIWPTNLAVFYPRPSAGWPIWPVLGSIALLGAITAVVLWRRRQQPCLVVGWLWFLGTLVPMIGIVQVGGQAMADRYTYLPTIGLLIAGAWMLPETLFRVLRGRIVLGTASGAMLLAMIIGTQRQIGFWANSQSLWEHSLAVTGPNHMANLNLAVDLVRRHDFADAKKLLDDELSRRPDDALVNNAYGAMLANQGDHLGAIQHYEAALRSDPRYATATYNLGTQLAAVGRRDEAVMQFQRAIELRPDYNEARTLLGIELARRGRMPEALAQFRAAVAIDPSDSEAQLALGRALTETGHIPEGLAHLDEALRLSPGMSEAPYFQGMALARQGRLSDAAARFRASLAIDPHDPDTQAALRQVLAAQSRSASIAE
jgi:tetratricopeptide (TPR) repeat protein